MSNSVMYKIEELPGMLVGSLAKMYHKADEMRSMLKALESGERLDSDNLYYIETLARDVAAGAANMRSIVFKIHDGLNIGKEEENEDRVLD